MSGRGGMDFAPDKNKLNIEDETYFFPLAVSTVFHWFASINMKSYFVKEALMLKNSNDKIGKKDNTPNLKLTKCLI